MTVTIKEGPTTTMLDYLPDGEGFIDQDSGKLYIRLRRGIGEYDMSACCVRLVPGTVPRLAYVLLRSQVQVVDINIAWG